MVGIRRRRRIRTSHEAARTGGERSTPSRTSLGTVAPVRQPSGLRHALRRDRRGGRHCLDNRRRNLIAALGSFGLGAAPSNLIGEDGKMIVTMATFQETGRQLD